MKALLLLLGWLPMLAIAQAYPAKTVRFIMPHVTGGPHDTVARGMAQSFGQTLGNRSWSRSPPRRRRHRRPSGLCCGGAHGYSLCVGYGSPFTLNPSLYAKLPYDPERDFAPIMHLGFLYSAVIAHPSVPSNSLRDLIEYSKSKPKTINWGTFGAGSITNLYVEWMNKTLGAQFYSVAYKSAIPAATAVMGGEIEVALLTVGVAGQAKAGKIKALAVIGGDKRSRFMPDLPTMKESGVDLTLTNWWGMFGRSGTPPDILGRLHSETKRLIDDPKFVETFFARQGFEMNEPVGE